MGQTMQVARRKYNFMVKGCFNIQKTIMELDQHFFLLFDQKWSKIVLIHRKCKYFEYWSISSINTTTDNIMLKETISISCRLDWGSCCGILLYCQAKKKARGGLNTHNYIELKRLHSYVSDLEWSTWLKVLADFFKTVPVCMIYL